MNKIFSFFVFLIMLKGSYAFNGSSSNYIMTHSNLNYGSHYNDPGNYTIDYSLVEQPVGSGVSGNYTYALGFYFGEAQDYFQRLMKDVNGVYPLMLLVMMLYVGSRISKKNGNEKEIQEASMAQ